MTRRRGLPPKGDFERMQPDPSRIGGVAETPFVRLPDPATLFAVRARRLAELAPGHSLEAYLWFLRDVVTAQAACVVACPPPVASGEQVRGNADFAATLTWLLNHLVLDAAPPAARAATTSVLGMTEHQQLDLAGGIQDGIYEADLVAESLFIAAGLQVHLSRLAAKVDPRSLTPSEHGGCPVCGGAPVSSVVVGWTQANKARYCACGLCGTLWNHVRIKCTACGATQGINYFSIEGGPTAVGIETCGECRCYIKHMQQHDDGRLEPLVDDVASYALDLLAREEGFRPSGVNPLLLTL